MAKQGVEWRCGICGCRLNVRGQDLTTDCGGDCWGCISTHEAYSLGVPLEEYRLRPDYYMNGDPNQ